MIFKGVLLFAFDVLVSNVCLGGEAGGDQVEDLTDSLRRKGKYLSECESYERK